MSSALTVIQSDDLDALPVQIDAAIADVTEHAVGMVAAALRAGELLLKAKAALPHGSWGQWVADNCTVKPRTASAYMRLAEKLPKLPEAERQRVADLPLRMALQAITTAPDAPPRYPTRHHPSRDSRERAAQALRNAADAQRKLARRVDMNFIKRAEIESARTKLQAALAALDRLQAGDEMAETGAQP